MDCLGPNHAVQLTEVEIRRSSSCGVRRTDSFQSQNSTHHDGCRKRNENGRLPLWEGQIQPEGHGRGSAIQYSLPLCQLPSRHRLSFSDCVNMPEECIALRLEQDVQVTCS